MSMEELAALVPPPPLPKKSNKQEPLEFKDVRSDCSALLADAAIARETLKVD